MHLETRLVRAGLVSDPRTGAISTPIYQTATFRHPGPEQSTGYDYSRTINPTREVLEKAMAELEGGARALACASGMAAIQLVSLLFAPGDHLVVSDDLYGGTYRFFQQVMVRYGLEIDYVDTTDIMAVERAVKATTGALFVETPTNPTMKVSDLRALASLARRFGLLLIVDNTFMTPYFQRPLELGADIVVHSATKYLGGHHDLVAGMVVTASPELGQRLADLHNCVGSILGPQDCWLLLRGLKTLAVRLAKSQENAAALAGWLHGHPRVQRVYYPGLESHPGHRLHFRQASGAGSVISFQVDDPGLVPRIISRLKMISYAESLGGVESLITYPATQTHGDLPEEVRERLGITSTLLRLAVGIENVADLIADLEQAMAGSEIGS
ncbi:MAG: PLP-dependent transferase [Clostridia bacterium]|nr:MAG: PLP-dependent transferase [Clostridia bacterium]